MNCYSYTLVGSGLKEGIRKMLEIDLRKRLGRPKPIEAPPPGPGVLTFKCEGEPRLIAWIASSGKAEYQVVSETPLTTKKLHERLPVDWLHGFYEASGEEFWELHALVISKADDKIRDERCMNRDVNSQNIDDILAEVERNLHL